MQLINFRLLVSDTSASIRFWRDIVQLPMQYGDEAMGYAYFETSSAGIELMQRGAFAAAIGTAAAAAPAGHLAAIVFRVDDVDSSYADLVARGATPVAGPQDRAEWGARSAQVADPDGYLVEVYSKLPSPAAPAA
jgi:predicted enzyme related to lactoylglutathione lyase